MLLIAFPVVTVVVFLLFGYLSALLYSPLYLVRWLRRRRAQVEKPERGRGRGCLMWVVYLLGIGALGLVVLVGINLTSPAVEPCPTNSPTILTRPQIFALLDAVVDQCTSVTGEVVSRDAGEMVVEINRGEYVQHVRVRGPAGVFEQVPLPGRVRLAGRIREDEEWGYVVQYGVDRGWWGNLRENLPGDILAP